MGPFKRKAAARPDDARSQDSPPQPPKQTWLDRPPLGASVRPCLLRSALLTVVAVCVRVALADSRLRQQRLPSWEPIFTPNLAMLLFFVVAIIFAPIGAVLYVDSKRVNELTFDYTTCFKDAGPDPSPMPSWQYQVDARKASNGSDSWPHPRWSWVDSSTSPLRKVCQVDFYVPLNLQKSVFFYYKLTNYYQAHRRYLRSFDSEQLLGHRRSLDNLKSQTCKPMHNFYRTYPNGSTIEVPIYPCGLIPNSVFNGVYMPLFTWPQTDQLPFKIPIPKSNAPRTMGRTWVSRLTR